MSNDSAPPAEGNKFDGLSQYHKGTGDNVSGDKKIYQAISPEEIHHPIRKVLTNLRHRQSAQAIEQLETLTSTSNLNSDSKGILDVISIRIDLNNNTIPSSAYQELSTYIGSEPDKLCTDITISTQIVLDSKKERHKVARERYLSIENPGVYSNEAFFEHIADEGEIDTAYRYNTFKLDEVELCGLFRGAHRLKSYELAFEISEYLNKFSTTLNSRTFIALAKAGILNSEYDQHKYKHYWCITSTLRRNIFKLCDDTVDLLNDSEGKDARIINLSASLLQFIYGEYEPLADTCWNYIAEIEKQLPEVAIHMRKTQAMSKGRLGKLLKQTKTLLTKEKLLLKLQAQKRSL